MRATLPFGPYGSSAIASIDRLVGDGANAIWFHGFNANVSDACAEYSAAPCVEASDRRAHTSRMDSRESLRVAEQLSRQVVVHRAEVMMVAGAVTALVACWWITVAIPIPVTSLLPLVLLGVVGVMPIGQAAVPYANANVFLFMGGFIIALGIERWGLHRRIALHIVRRIGTSRATIVLGFMLATAGLSMWISNTATTLLNFVGVALITATFYLLAKPILGLDLTTIPAWAK